MARGLGLALVVALFVFLAFAMYLVSLYQPVEVGSQRRTVISIPSGASTSQIGAILQRTGLIKHQGVFRLLARVRNADGRLKAGEYELSPGLSVEEILRKLERGEVATRAFTIPEGLTVEEIAAILAARGFGDRDAILRTMDDPALTRELLAEAGLAAAAAALTAPGILHPLEGYLFPDTYRVAPDTPPRDLIAMMLKRFRKAYTPAMAERARAQGLSLHQVVTLASIVEEEAAAPRERPLIAGVYWNRLKDGMKLDADPTVRYALGKRTEPLLLADLDVSSPYNTYRRIGLPPGPIAAPGLASLLAALYPAEVPHLYFVARQDGTHAFSRTLAEHLKNVRRYQAGR